MHLHGFLLSYIISIMVRQCSRPYLHSHWNKSKTCSLLTFHQLAKMLVLPVLGEPLFTVCSVMLFAWLPLLSGIMNDLSILQVVHRKFKWDAPLRIGLVGTLKYIVINIAHLTVPLLLHTHAHTHTHAHMHTHTHILSKRMECRYMFLFVLLLLM